MYMLDMPKLESPFVRDTATHKVTPQVAEGFEWVFNDPSVLAVEKLDGTNVSIYIESGELIAVRNRTTPIECNNLSTNRFMEGLRNTYNKGMLPVSTGQHFGELVGPKIQSNLLKLDAPLWYPFEYLKRCASYRSYHRFDKTFENISSWFKNDLFSLLIRQKEGEIVQPEGVVFHHSDGRMAKLRLDMFDWWKGKAHKE